MSDPMPKGANRSLLVATEYQIEIRWAPERPAGQEVDASGFLLEATGRVGQDADFVFYNHPHSPCGSLELSEQAGAFCRWRIQPQRVPEHIVRIALCVTLHGGGSLAQARSLELCLRDANGNDLALIRPVTSELSEAALILGEVYRHRGGWKIRSVAQGFAGGLGPLARSFGVAVADEPPTTAPPPPPAATPRPLAPVAATPVFAPREADCGPEYSRVADLHYEILYRGAYAMARIELPRGRQLRAESDAMVAMHPALDVGSQVSGGLLGGLGRLVSGESFFLQTLSATRGTGSVFLAPAAPGDVAALEIDSGDGLIIQRGGFLACSQGVEIDTKIQNLAHGLFSGAGLFVIRAQGRGLVFVESFGAIHRLELGPGEQRIVDNGHLVAWSTSLRYGLELGSRGLVAAFTSGENIVCRFHGPGTLLIQSRQPRQFGRWIARMLPG